jgi:hypothetical protein
LGQRVQIKPADPLPVPEAGKANMTGRSRQAKAEADSSVFEAREETEAQE